MSNVNLRCIAYIDGYNLYHGIDQSRKHQELLASRGESQPGVADARRLFWLNLSALSRSIFDDLDVREIKYFTSRVSGSSPDDSAEVAAMKDSVRARQVAWLDAVSSLDGVQIIEGKWLEKRVTCRACSTSTMVPTEKMTDVQIAVEMMADAIQDRFDVAILVSGDSDLVPAIRKIALLASEKEIRLVFPPNRFSGDLANSVGTFRRLRLAYLERCRLPDRVTRADGHLIECPDIWR